MAATIIDLADAVVAMLNAATLEMSFTAVRAYVPTYEQADLETLRVTVIPMEVPEISMRSRLYYTFDYRIDVAIQQRVNPIDNPTIDPYLLLAEQVTDLFRGEDVYFGAGGRARCVAVGIDPLYDPSHLDELRTFTSAVQLRFHIHRRRDDTA
jgi:hypothetical protein